MSRYLQLHLLTFYPPANLNRDDTNKPKTAVMGGEPRLRVSSQSLKRSWRTSTAFANALEGHLASRTQRMGHIIENHLVDGLLAEKPDEARKIAREIGAVFGKLKPANDPDPTYTEQLAFISPQEQAAAIQLAEKRAKGEDKTDPAKFADGLLLRVDTAADIAMFGRMLADNADFNREAAVSVAHAVTTHRVVVEDDFYTAVDDLKKPSEDSGAGFIGEAGFGSGVFYLYIVVDRELLLKNLGGDASIAKTAIEALVEAAATTGPAAKAKSFGSYARTSYILAELGDGAPRTLAAAFVKPVDKGEQGRIPNDLLAASVSALKTTHENFGKAYPDDVPASLIMDVTAGQGAIGDISRFAVGGM